MLNIDSLRNGIVIDHITAGRGMQIYELLELQKLECGVALIKNAKSAKYGKKDIIKIDGVLDINFDVLGFVDDKVTVCSIVDGKIVKKQKMVLPKVLTNVIRCKNPRCITSAEEGIDHVFYLGSGKSQYRCKYCEQEYAK